MLDGLGNRRTLGGGQSKFIHALTVNGIHETRVVLRSKTRAQELHFQSSCHKNVIVIS